MWETQVIRTHLPDCFPQGCVEGGGGGDDLREAGGGREVTLESSPGPHVRDPVKSLRPPLVPLDPEPGDCRGIVHQQLDLLLQCEPSDEVPHPLRGRSRDLAEGEVLSVRVSRVAREQALGGPGRAGKEEEAEEEAEGGGNGEPGHSLGNESWKEWMAMDCERRREVKVWFI